MLTDYVQLIYALEQQGLYKEASLFDNKLLKVAQEASKSDFSKALMSELLLNTEPFNNNERDWKKNEHLWLLPNGQVLSTGGIGHFSFIKLLIQKMQSDGAHHVPEDTKETLSRYGPERFMAHYLGAVRIYVPLGLSKIYITSAIRPTHDQIQAIQGIRQSTGFKVEIEQLTYTPLVYDTYGPKNYKAFNSTENWSRFIDKNNEMPVKPTKQLIFDDQDEPEYSVSKVQDARRVEQYQNPKLKELYTKSAKRKSRIFKSGK